MQLEKIFECRQVDEYKRFALAILSYLEYAMSWWKQRQYDVRTRRNKKNN